MTQPTGNREFFEAVRNRVAVMTEAKGKWTQDITPADCGVEIVEESTGAAHVHEWRNKWETGKMIGQECSCGAERDISTGAAAQDKPSAPPR